MTNHAYDQTKAFLDQHAPERPMTPRDLAVLLHAGMKALKWQRFDNGGTMAERTPEISIMTDDGRELIISVREVS